MQRSYICIINIQFTVSEYAPTVCDFCDKSYYKNGFRLLISMMLYL